MRRVTFEKNTSTSLSTSTSVSKKGILKRDNCSSSSSLEVSVGDAVASAAKKRFLTTNNQRSGHRPYGEIDNEDDDDELPNCYSVSFLPVREDESDNDNCDEALSLPSSPVEPIDLSPKSSSARPGRLSEVGSANGSGGLSGKNVSSNINDNRAWGQSGSIPPLDTTTRRPKAVKTALTFN